ncbi:pirin family protein [Gammaproteobacteria bacterium AB-CW1]|uniref:Pirin family protein n=1 Tax=Natronospira elongata TaxID=3110268 RepID=A0AAP6JCP9_9GAMM|nr:pirin family protein [Gammaproteobacteria bacterium AB-CW1]
MTTAEGDRDCIDLDCANKEQQPTIQRLQARHSDVGGIPVARSLPTRGRRLIGHWCFLDHAGPARFAPDSDGMQVGPHPHTCLQTFTWMIKGKLLHRDSLGYEQIIRPGQVNLMTAGAGISHTEASLPGESDLHAAQLWIALPHEDRHTAPRFDHYPELPRFEQDGFQATLLMGEQGEHRAPTLSFSPLLGMDLAWPEAARTQFSLRPDFEYGILPLEGGIDIEGEHFAENELAYLGLGRDRVAIASEQAGRALLIGGEPMPGRIHMWWNFVGHSREEIEEAQKDWEAGAERFGHIPRPNRPRLEAPPIPWKQP